LATAAIVNPKAGKEARGADDEQNGQRGQEPRGGG
jgi:hypothetical protein